MKRNRAIAIVLIISTLCTLVQGFQRKNVQAENAEDFIYNIENGEVTITGYTGDITGDLIIPDYIEGYPVTVIGERAFNYGAELHAFIGGKLQLPENLKRIGLSAFCGCCFGESLNLPEGLEYIGGYAFSDCGFLSGDLIIPDSVTEIGGMAFRHDSGFDGILKLSNQLKVINESTFYYCSGLEGILDLQDNLQGIRYSAFYGANHLVGPVVIPDSVEFIERCAFDACNINAMYVPATVTKIGQSALSIGGDGNTVYTPKDSLAYQIVTSKDNGSDSCTKCRIANSSEEMMQMLGLADTPTPAPTSVPTPVPTATATATATSVPIPSPTATPTAAPTFNPTSSPTKIPIPSPTATPTKAPTPNPTVTPSPQPSSEPTMRPTVAPTDETTLVLPTSGPEGEVKFEQKGVSTTMIPIPADRLAEPAPILASTATPKKDNNTLSAPVFSLKKKVSSTKQKYIQIKLKRYAGSYIEVYVKVDNRSYVKLKLAESKISKIKKSLKFSYSFSKHTLYFKLRTYKKIGKKIIYSKRSKKKRIRV